jgi:hypothetical protein
VDLTLFGARFGLTLNRGGSQTDTDPTNLSGRNVQVSGLDCSDERSFRQKIAVTLRTIGIFPMTHHVECVALVVPAAH